MTILLLALRIKTYLNIRINVIIYVLKSKENMFKEKGVCICSKY